MFLVGNWTRRAVLQGVANSCNCRHPTGDYLQEEMRSSSLDAMGQL